MIYCAAADDQGEDLVAVGWIRSGLDFFGAGNLVLAIIGLLLTPFVDRMLIRRKRLGFRVLYNSKIGLDFGALHDDHDSGGAGAARAGPPKPPGAQSQAQSGPATPAPATQLYRLSRLLDRMSIVVIRIRNTGSHHIDPEDFEQPLSFTFGRRMVWNARISEGGSREEEDLLRASLRFFRNDADLPAGPADRDNLRTVRDRFVQRMSRLFGGSAIALDDDTGGDPTWHGVRLESLALRRRQRFKLVVVLREPDSGDGDSDGKISKDYRHGGKLGENGLIKDEGEVRRLTLQRVTGGLAALLTVLLVLALAFAPAPADPSIACASGQLRIEGSTVFVPTVRKIADDYMAGCRGAHLQVQTTGSIAGVRAVSALDPAHTGDLIAFSDGKQQVAAKGMYTEQLAVVVYDIIVHKSAGLDSLTTSQLRGIYDGTYTDWSQLRGGAPLHIRIVGRGSESGTRELFERKVLGTAEGELTSDNCSTPDRAPQARVTRCERDDNSEIVQVISHTEGTIGYADSASVAEARKTGDVTALALDERY
jgi:ABC-type phosphate transport system substrate-binding protein